MTVTLTHPEHEPILRAALRAPSVHNTQAWRLAPIEGSAHYELHYARGDDDSSYDPGDRNAYLSMGMYYETLRLAAHRYGFDTEFEDRFERIGDDIFVGVVSIRPLAEAEPIDPLATAATTRTTNRSRYDGRPVPKVLRREFEKLGNRMLEPEVMAPLVENASARSWTDKRFVRDLKSWIHFEEGHSTGMTPGSLGLSAVDRAVLKFAFWRGHLGNTFARSYAATRGEVDDVE